MLERNDLMNTKMNSMKKLAALMAVVTSVSTLTACGDAMDTSGSDYAMNNEKGAQHYTEAAIAAEDYANDAAPADDEAMPPEMNSVDNSDIQQNDEEYNYIKENGYTAVSSAPLSTFSADVDTASYTNVRRMIDDGMDVPPDAVRIEEFINYFDYDYTDPADGEPFAVHTELSDCPWNDETELLMVGINTKGFDAVLDERPAMNLVFLIDVSGSMYDDNKLPLVQKSFSMLTDNLTAADRVSIVTYAGSDEVVLEGADGNDRKKILRAINDLEAGGSTAGAAGINTAYDIAQKYFIDGGNNRVILATDGDLNVGLSSEEELTDLISQKRDSGVYLSVLGFGSGNYKDNRLEALADNGNGNYAYIDSVDEAKRVLVTEMSGTLFTVAKDAKVQIEFNPENVSAYRLVGYENRLLNDEDFEDDTKDAGDIGSGQQVTVLYEIVPNNGNEKSLKYQDNESKAETNELSGEMLTVSVRYKDPEASESKLIDKSVMCSDYTEAVSQNFAKACSAAEFAMVLRKSDYASGLTAQGVVDYMEQNNVDNSELFELIYKYMQNGTGSEASYW